MASILVEICVCVCGTFVDEFLAPREELSERKKGVEITDGGVGRD